MVVIDNGSSDDSWNRIKGWASGHEPDDSRFIPHRWHKEPLNVVSYSKVESEAGGTEAGEALLSGTSPARTLTLIQSGRNRGYAGGCNIGIRYALKRGADYLWLLNNDTIVHPRALSEMVALAASDKKVGLVGSILYDFYVPESVQAYGGGLINWWLGTSRYLKEPENGRLDYLTGASLLIKRPVVESVGLLDESYFFYWEDIAYSQRVLKAGWGIRVAEGSRVLHKEGGAVSGGQGGKSFMSDQFMVKGMITFFSSHGDAWWPLTMLLYLGGMVINRLRRGQANRIFPLLRTAVTHCWEINASRVRRLAQRPPGNWKKDGSSLDRHE